MAFLRSDYIILISIVGNVLYANAPNDVQTMKICTRNNSKSNICNEWEPMKFVIENGGKLQAFSYNIPGQLNDSGLYYKLRLGFYDRTYGEMPFLQSMYNHTTHMYRSTTNPSIIGDNTNDTNVTNQTSDRGTNNMTTEDKVNLDIHLSAMMLELKRIFLFLCLTCISVIILFVKIFIANCFSKINK